MEDEEVLDVVETVNTMARVSALQEAARHFSSFVNCSRSYDGFEVAKILRQMAKEVPGADLHDAQ